MKHPYFKDSIKEKSFFVRIPKALNAHERLSIEGIYYSAQMIGLAYERLLHQTAAFSIDAEETDEKFSLQISIISDCWTMIDNLHRLRILFRNYPRLNLPILGDIKKFLSRSKAAETMRNRFQHLSEQLPDRKELVRSGQGLLGNISWIYLSSKEPGSLGEGSTIEIHGIAAGSPPSDQNRTTRLHFSDPKGSKFTPPTSRIEIFAFDNNLDLSEQVENLSSCMTTLDSEFERSITARAKALAESKKVDIEMLLEPIMSSAGFFVKGRLSSSAQPLGTAKIETGFHNPTYIIE